MITAQLVGGLGNQMFQYAAGRALALRRGVGLRLDASEFKNYHLHSYGLNHLAISAEVTDRRQPASTGSRVLDRLRDLVGLGAPALYRESGLRFDPAVLALPGNTTLAGYWQCERYFADHADLIRAELSVKTPAIADNLECIERLRSGMPVSVHIRRGDYVSNTLANSVHGTCDIAYYEAAARYIAERCAEAPTFYVFSDDPDWVRENFRIPFEIVLVRHNGADRNYEDLRLMSGCRHHIIANSSFSWWGAWLNPSPDKIVVAPQRWFKTSDLDSTDLVPASWVRL